MLNIEGLPAVDRSWSWRAGNCAVASLLCLLVAALATTRAGLVEDGQSWLTLSTTGRFSAATNSPNPWRYSTDAQFQWWEDSADFSRVLLRAGLGYVISPHWSLWGGYGFVWTDPPVGGAEIQEHRLWQQVLWAGEWRGFHISLRHRLEERFVEGSQDTAWRSRHQLRASHLIPGTAKLSVILWDELLFHLNDTSLPTQAGLDQNRCFGGLGWQWTHSLRTEIGYMNQYYYRHRTSDHLNHVLSLTQVFTF